MKIGETYYFSHLGETINNGVPTGIVFVVVSEIENFLMIETDNMDRPGFVALLLEGRIKESVPGSTFTFSQKSFIAVESVRFPAKE